MKKYEKPKILFENLEFNTAIAACAWVTVAECMDPNPENSIFETPFQMKDEQLGGIMTYMNTSENQMCKTNGYCYNIPSQLENDKGLNSLS